MTGLLSHYFIWIQRKLITYYVPAYFLANPLPMQLRNVLCQPVIPHGKSRHTVSVPHSECHVECNTLAAVNCVEYML